MSPGAIHAVAECRSCSVSVVSHGQGPLVERLLADLATVSPPSVAEVLVTRNLPNDPIALPDGLRFPVRFIDNPAPKGFAANHNAAFAECGNPWFAVLNPDLRLVEDPFEPLLAAADPETALLCPRVLEPDGSEADAARTLPTPTRLLGRVLRRIGSASLLRRGDDPRHAGPATYPDWFAGMFMLLRSNAFRGVGGFDQRYRLYCEDVDLCARLRLSGWEMQRVAGASVVHDARRASRHSANYFAWHVAGIARLWSSSSFWRYRTLRAAQRRAASSAARVRSRS